MNKVTEIEYKGKGFWLEEFMFEVVSQYICETMESIGVSSFSTNLKSIYANCDANRSGVNYGMVGVVLDKLEHNDTDRSTFISVLNQTKTTVLALGAEISITALNDWEANVRTFENHPGWWSKPIKTSSIVNTLDLMVQLLSSDNFPMDNHYFFYEGWEGPEWANYI